MLSNVIVDLKVHSALYRLLTDVIQILIQERKAGEEEMLP